ncbi:MAG: AraC family transcriptional regulator [Taibaiella sp.]|nr:AraC family transcriptional regulator [Taibaiella sp.]
MICYKEFPPSQELAGLIKSYYSIIHTGSRKPSPQRITPDGCIELNFNLGAPIKRTDENTSTLVDKVYIVMRASLPYFAERTGNTHILGIKFYPWGIRSFIDIPVYELKDKLLYAGDIWGSAILALRERIGNMDSMQEIIPLLEEYLIAKARQNNEDKLITYLCSNIMKGNGNAQLTTILKDANISERRLQQRFHDAIGYGPKLFVRLNRYHNALKQLNKHTTASLTDITYDNHYFDQSHFIKDFTCFSGISPKRYQIEQHLLNDLMVANL